MKEHEVFEMRMWKGSLNRYTTTNKRGIHMDSTWINAPAKINLGLDVIRRRDDGYHEVKMIMQSIRLFDRLTLKKTKTPDISLTTNLHFLPVNEDNLVYKSAKMLMEEFGISEGVSITLDKRIPVAAGMAGGSTDAASCMIAMNQLFDLGLSDEDLKERGVKLGADIPYCIQKGTALSEGIGARRNDRTSGHRHNDRVHSEKRLAGTLQQYGKHTGNRYHSGTSRHCSHQTDHDGKWRNGCSDEWKRSDRLWHLR